MIVKVTCKFCQGQKMIVKVSAKFSCQGQNIILNVSGKCLVVS